MKKTLIALSTGFFIASSAAAFADTSALDVMDQPERSTSSDLIPNFGLFGGSDYSEGENASTERFGDTAPDISTEEGTIGIDYTPTASTAAPTVIDEENSADNSFGDQSPSNEVLR